MRHYASDYIYEYDHRRYCLFQQRSGYSSPKRTTALDLDMPAMKLQGLSVTLVVCLLSSGLVRCHIMDRICRGDDDLSHQPSELSGIIHLPLKNH